MRRGSALRTRAAAGWLHVLIVCRSDGRTGGRARDEVRCGRCARAPASEGVLALLRILGRRADAQTRTRTPHATRSRVRSPAFRSRAFKGTSATRLRTLRCMRGAGTSPPCSGPTARAPRAKTRVYALRCFVSFRFASFCFVLVCFVLFLFRFVLFLSFCFDLF